jgi:hypothetical protein
MILDTVFLLMTGVCILTLLILSKKDKGGKADPSGKAEGYTYETNENPNSYAVLGEFGIVEDRTIVEDGKKDKSKDDAEDDAEAEADAEQDREKRNKMKYAYMKAQQQEQRDRRLERTVRTLA